MPSIEHNCICKEQHMHISHLMTAELSRVWGSTNRTFCTQCCTTNIVSLDTASEWTDNDTNIGSLGTASQWTDNYKRPTRNIPSCFALHLSRVSHNAYNTTTWRLMDVQRTPVHRRRCILFTDNKVGQKWWPHVSGPLWALGLHTANSCHWLTSVCVCVIISVCLLLARLWVSEAHSP